MTIHWTATRSNAKNWAHWFGSFSRGPNPKAKALGEEQQSKTTSWAAGQQPAVRKARHVDDQKQLKNKRQQVH